jgi:hypothetical protein
MIEITRWKLILILISDLALMCVASTGMMGCATPTIPGNRARPAIRRK